MSDPAQRPELGFIGPGLMGHGMAKHLLGAGYHLRVLGHRNRAPVEDLVARGAEEAKSTAAIAAAAEILFLCVPSSAVVEDLVEGDGGILRNGSAGLVVVDTTTGDPAVTLRLGARLRARGMALVDAPVTRSPREAEEGRLNILLGGEPGAIARVRPVVAAFSENVFEIGPPGSALKLKLLNNLLSLTHAAVAAEAVAAARVCGVDPRRLHEVVSQGGANSAMWQMIVPRLLAGDDTGLQFSLRNARKDLRCYGEMLGRTDLPTVIGGATHDLFRLASALGRGDAPVGALAEMLGALAAGVPTAQTRSMHRP